MKKISLLSVFLLALVTACSSAKAIAPEDTALGTAELPLLIPEAQVTSALDEKAKNVAIDKPLTFNVEKGDFEKISVKEKGAGKLKGEVKDGVWTSTERLSPNASYSATVVARDNSGLATTYKKKFSTVKVPLDKLVYASVSPGDGAKVGIGMPVVIRFDVPVKDKKSFEKHIKVTNTADQEGSFYWLSDNELRWRPKEYWKPGTKVSVKADIKSLPAGNGTFGQYDIDSDFTVGRKQVVKVNMKTHKLSVIRDGKNIKTMNTSTGEPRFETRIGTKVIMEKHRYVDMNSASVGIAPESATGII